MGLAMKQGDWEIPVEDRPRKAHQWTFLHCLPYPLTLPSHPLPPRPMSIQHISRFCARLGTSSHNPSLMSAPSFMLRQKPLTSQRNVRGHEQ